MSESQVTVQSIADAAGKPVAVTLHTYAGQTSAYAIQHMGIVGVDSAVPDGKNPPLAYVYSAAGANALAVGLTDRAGNLLETLSVTAIQGNAPWSQVGSVQATQAGAWTVTATLGLTSLPVTQQSSPWSVQGSVTATIPGAVTVSGSVSGTVVASVVGGVAVTQQTSPWVTVGSMLASQGGAPWTTVTSVPGLVTVSGTLGVTQVTSPWIVQVASTPPGRTVTGSVQATQGGSWGTFLVGGPTAQTPGLTATVRSWNQGDLLRVSIEQGTITGGGDGKLLDRSDSTIAATVRSYASGIYPAATQLVSSGGVLAEVSSLSGGNALKVDVVQGTLTSTQSVYASQVGNWAVAASITGGTLAVTQTTSPWIVQVASQPALSVTTTASVFATQVTSPWIVLAGSSGALQTVLGSVAATIQGNVPVTQVTSPWIVQVASQPAVSVTTTQSVYATQVGAPWTTQAASSGAIALVQGSISGTVVASVVGNISVTQVSSPWVVYVATTVGGTTSAGSVWASQVTSPWVTLPGSSGALRLVTGSVGASQLGAPWTVTGSALVQGQVAHDAVYAGNPLGLGGLAYDVAQTSVTAVNCGDMVSLMADREGRLRIKVDSGTVRAEQSGTWTTVATLGVAALPVTQSTNPWTISGSVAGVVVSSVVGQVTVTASLVGVPTIVGSVLASQGGAPWSVTGSFAGTTVTSVIGQPTVTASVVGAVSVTQGTTPWLVTGSVGVTQISSPWSVLGSVSGTVVASVPGQLTVTASLIGQPTITASVVGNIGVTQVSSPWVVYVSTQAGGAAGVSSVFATQVTSPWIVQVASMPAVTTTASVFASQVSSPWIMQATSGQEPGRPVPFANILTGGSFSIAQFQGVTHPVQFIKIAATVGSGGRDYPFDGDYTCDSMTAGTPVIMALDRTNINSSVNYAGTLVVMMSGSATGHVRRFDTWSAAQIAGALNAGWDATAVATVGDKFRVLIPTLFRSQALIRSEYSASTNKATVALAFYDWPRSPEGTPVAEAPLRYMDAPLDLDNLGLNVNSDTLEPSYWHGRTRRVDVYGALGFKVFLVSLDAGSVSLWAAGA